MQSYVVKPTTIKKSQILKKEEIFSATGYYQVTNNSNMHILSNLLNGVFKGEDLEEKDFLNFKTSSKYLKTASLTGDNYLLDETTNNTFEYINPNLNKSFQKRNRIIRKYDILYTSTGSNNRIGDCALAPNDLNHNFSSHIFKLDLKKSINKFYLFALLKSNYGKEACDLEIPKAGIMRRGGKRFLNLKIPFPTNKNNNNTKEVEELISSIVQNIIDKEEQIKEKNKLIDGKIEIELKENQKSDKFSYSYPKVGKIRENNLRFDTGLFEKNFNKFDFLINNYTNGAFVLKDKNYEVFRGQNLQITNIGRSYYSKQKLNDKFYTVILSSNISEDSVVTGKGYLGNIKKLKLIEPEDIIFCSRGAQFGRGAVFPEIEKSTITNIDNMHIRNKTSNLSEKVFLCQFLRYLRKNKHLYKIAIFGNGSFSFTKYHLSDLSFPKFPESKQKEISKIYYHKVDKNKDLTFENYLNKEKSRNKQIGIFQLNTDIFNLKDILENLIHKIVTEEKIEISFNY